MPTERISKHESLPAGKIEKYGAFWPKNASELKIEMACIVAGGKWKKGDLECGAGMFHHYKEAQTLIWPEEDHHRWSDLILNEYLNNRITVLMGSRDSGKTRGISKAVLIDYYCFPEDTLTLMTSTNMRGLELRVWGDIKSLHQRALDRYPHLPGNISDSKHGIFTDAIEETGDIRDQRKGILTVPCLGSHGEYMGDALRDFCFSSGTMVDTPSGPTKIESIKVGDIVYSALGENRVSGTSTRIAPLLIRLHLSNGSHIDCTPNHRFLTDSGWKIAVDILPKDRLISTHEAMRIMRETIPPKVKQGSILFQTLFDEVEMATTGTSRKNDRRYNSLRNREREENQPGDSGKLRGSSKAKREDDSFAADAEGGSHCTGKKYSVQRTRNKSHSNPSGKAFAGNVSGGVSRFQHTDREKRKAWALSNVLVGFGVAGFEAGCGIGRLLSPHGSTEIKRLPEGLVAQETRVDSFEVLGSPSSEPQRHREAGHRVYNLEVEGHPSYSVSGVLVHNCGIKQRRRRLIGDELQFLPRDYLKVLDSLDKGDFKAAFCGNPIAENGKALDAVSEPKCGWGSQPEITKTTVWDNKYNGKTVCLVGIDSPNFDPETKNRFSYLVDQSDVDRVSGRPGGRDSLEWWSQIMGVRKAGAVSSSVLTIPEIEACEGFRQPIWEGNSSRTRIYSIDAGFGGDECVESWLEFGKLVDGTTAISFGDQRVIPILLSLVDSDGQKVMAEKQISKHAKARCDVLGIPPANVFFDAGMFATLAVEMAREMTSEVNAVNFGGVATDRPVSSDMFMFEHDEHRRRLKTWNEHVSKFVTELWFVVRLVTQCHQIRQFPRDAAEEFSRRQWTYVSRDRYELETKDDYKLRNSGESPNRADSLVIAVEGARRRGFQIKKMANPKAEQKNLDWLKDLKRSATTHTAHELSYK